MLRLLTTVIFSLCLCTYGNFSANLSFKDCGKKNNIEQPENQIVGGRFAAEGEFPWQLSIQTGSGDSFSHICGAAIIKASWAITTAHCVEGLKPSDIVIKAGIIDLESSKPERGAERGEGEKRRKSENIYEISMIISHKDYSGEPNFLNDIALLKTEKPIDIKGSKGMINAICLPSSDMEIHNKNVTITGWGQTQRSQDNQGTKNKNNQKNASGKLRTADVSIVPNSECKFDYTNENLDVKLDLICVFKGGRDSCSDDSGDLSIEVNYEHRIVLVGIISSGFGCAPEIPSAVVYIRISKYLDWIEKQMKQ